MCKKEVNCLNKQLFQQAIKLTTAPTNIVIQGLRAPSGLRYENMYLNLPLEQIFSWGDTGDLKTDVPQSAE